MVMMIVILLYFPNHEGNATISIESNLCYAIIETTAMTSAAQQATSSDLVAHVVRNCMYMFLSETSQATRSSSLSPSCTCCASVGICFSKAYCSPLHFSFFSTSAVSVCFAMIFFLLVVVVVLKSTLAPCKFCLGLLEHGFNFCHMLLLSTNAGCSVVVRLSAYSTSHVCKCKGAAKKDYKPRRSEMAPAGMKTTMVR